MCQCGRQRSSKGLSRDNCPPFRIPPSFPPVILRGAPATRRICEGASGTSRSLPCSDLPPPDPSPRRARLRMTVGDVGACAAARHALRTAAMPAPPRGFLNFGYPFLALKCQALCLRRFAAGEEASGPELFRGSQAGRFRLISPVVVIRSIPLYTDEPAVASKFPLPLTNEALDVCQSVPSERFPRPGATPPRGLESREPRHASLLRSQDTALLAAESKPWGDGPKSRGSGLKLWDFASKPRYFEAMSRDFMSLPRGSD